MARRALVVLTVVALMAPVALVAGRRPQADRIASGPEPTSVAAIGGQATSTVPVTSAEPTATARASTSAPVRAGSPPAPAPRTTPNRPPTTATTVAPGLVRAAATTVAARPSTPSLPPAFAGLGTWVDVFDFDPAHTNGRPTVTPADVDRMAAAGVRTIYLQAARPADPASPGDLVSPALLGQFLTRAHARKMKVVAWYLPYFADLNDDMRHLSAMLAFSVKGQRFDGIGLDIEWRAAVPDAATRSSQLIELSRRLKLAAKGRPLGAIVLPPVVTDVINTAYWPGFPWLGIRPYFNAWLPMGYWTNRRAGTPDHNAYRYTMDNTRLLRGHLGNVPIHFIGGIGDQATAADYQDFLRATRELGLGGRSLYDWATTGPGPTAALR